MAGDLIAEDFEVDCRVKLVTPTSWLKNLQRNQEISSYDVIHKALVYGFEISWLNLPCQDLQCGDSIRCVFDSNQKLLCYDLPCNKTWGGDPRKRPCVYSGTWYQQLALYKPVAKGKVPNKKLSLSSSLCGIGQDYLD
ncbi:hypothetical protein TSUD_11360 [Trifolium subterraneum]|nr:hypothetical protein TSUD_11360 [Trifolium subterraneum]